jgi:septum formation inhibitor MinC
VHVSKVQQENNIWYVSSPSLAVYPCAYRLFHVTPEAINVETYHVSFPALIKKAKNAFISCTLAYKYSSNKPASFAAIAEGTRLDSDVSLPLIAGKPVQALEKKKTEKQKKEKAAKTSSKNRKEPKPQVESENAGKADPGPANQEPKPAPDLEKKSESNTTPQVAPKAEAKPAAPSSGENNDK